MVTTPPRSSDSDSSYPRFMDHTHTPFMRPTASVISESTTTNNLALPYSTAYDATPYSMHDRSHPYSQTLSPSETLSPGPYRNIHTSAIDATVPGFAASSQTSLYSGARSLVLIRSTLHLYYICRRSWFWYRLLPHERHQWKWINVIR